MPPAGVPLTEEFSTADCPLCNAAHNVALMVGGTNVNTIIGRSEEFLIIPALGPLVPGHVLVISKTHSEGLRFLSPEMRQRYKLLSDEIHAYCAQTGDTVLEAEHGASTRSARGPCIRHTHVHILPGLGDAIAAFHPGSDSQLPLSAESSRIDPYIWLSNGGQEKFYPAPHAHGQEIRRTIGAYLEFDDWDWAVSSLRTRSESSGATYEIDLAAKNRGKLEKALAPFVDNGRRVSGRRRQRSASHAATSRQENAAIRA
jgi:diadenosine tetraphosphate (Ap4A) HIT family hydrolase